MPRTNETPCWSCGERGAAIAGNSWLRECVTCEVQWNAHPGILTAGQAQN